MNKHQIHYGKTFYLDKKTGYWISTACPKIRAHRFVWIHNYGQIPEGCHIHHKNEDKSDNSIENLELMARSAHLRLHMTEERRKASGVRAGEIRHLTKEWHASEEGKAWHKYHALKNKFGKWEAKKLKCQVCSKQYETTKRSNTKFCSNVCKSKFRRSSGLDDVIRDCPSCNLQFSCNKYAKTVYCSKSCAQKRKD
jgi:hypothetical protein